ncbi:MAG TPA: glycosyltransferase, partial [Terrimicrobiaceae bacterium]
MRSSVNDVKVLPEERRPLPSFRVMLVGEPGLDGVFRHLEALAHYLCSREIQTDLAYSSIRGSPALHELVHFIEAHGGKTLDLRTGNRPALSDIPAFNALLRFVENRRPDVLHAHSSKAGALVRAMRVRGMRLPIFYTPHAYYGMGRRRSPLPLLFDSIEALLSRIGRTINVSRTEAEYARAKLRLTRERQLIIPNGVDCERYCPATDETRAKTRQLLGLPQDALVLGTVARYCYQKDPLTIHKAVRTVLQRNPRLWFIHVGHGSQWREVDGLGTHERILRLKSFQPMESFYKALDGFVLASRYEGLSLSVLEALATNLPLILTRVDGN